MFIYQQIFRQIKKAKNNLHAWPGQTAKKVGGNTMVLKLDQFNKYELLLF